MARKQEVFGVTVEGDISGLRKAMNDAVREFKSTEKALKSINKAVELDPTDTKMLEQQRDVYKKAIEENQEALKKLQKIRNDIVSDPHFQEGVTDMTEKFQKVNLEIKQVTKRGEELRKELRNLPSENVAKINDKFKKLEETLKKSKDSIEMIKKSISNVNKQIDINPKNLDLYVQKNKLLNDELNATGKAIKDLKKKQEDLNNTPGFLNGNFKSREHIEQMSAISLEIAEMEKRYKELEKQLKQTTPAMERFFTVCEKVGNRFTEIGNATKWLSRAFQGLSTASIKAAMDYESNIANIRRVVSDLSNDTIRDLKDIAIETGNTFKDISDYATIGGALGLAEDELSRFTRAMVDLNTATGGVFSGEEGAKGIAVFLKQLNLGIDQAENFGSAIAVIGDKYADIGDETVNVATRLTGLNSIIKTNQYELIGLAGVMADLGLATDSNANGINRAFIQIDKTIHGGVKNSSDKLKELATTAGMTSKQFKEAWNENAMEAFLKFTDGLKSSVFNEINSALEKSTDHVQKYADVLGLSADQFERLWKEDSSRAFDLYVEALGELGDEGEVASKVLSDLGISSVNTAQTLLRLAGNGNEVRKAIELTEQAWRENTALTEKSGIIYETTAYKLKGMWESLKQLGDALGQQVLPHIKDFTDGATELTREFSLMSPQAKKLVTIFIALGASFSPVTRGIGTILKNLPKIVGFLSGPGGIITLTATLIGILAKMGNLEGFYRYADSMEELRNKAKNLNDVLVENVSLADQQYRIREQEIDQYKVEAEEIDFLIRKLKEEKLTNQERAEIKKRIKEYIDELNEALGTEAFKFDEATGKIKAQGDAVDSVKSKFAELSAQLKQETWLDAHKSVLEQAYSDLDKSSSILQSATRNYLAQAENIPQGIKDVFSEYKGNLDAFAAYLEANQIAVGEYSYEQLKSWTDIWDTFKSATDEAHTTVDNAQAVIDGYNAVANSTVDTLEENINGATEAINIMQEGVSMTQQSLEELKAQRDAYYQTLTDEQKTNDILLQKYDEQIAKLEKQVAYEDRKKLLAEGTLESVREYIRLNDEWQPQDKVQNIRVNYIGLRDLGISGYSAGSWVSMNSRGYGDLLKSTMNNVRSSLGNFRSGGYKSGGITVNANFTVNSNNIGRNDVRNWSSWIIDDINEALGKQM